MDSYWLSLVKTLQDGTWSSQKFPLHCWDGLDKYQDSLLALPRKNRHRKLKGVELTMKHSEGDQVLIWDWRQ